MKPLDYSSNPYSELNEARRAFWIAKDMISAANKNPELYDRAFWFGQMNRHRNTLRKIANDIRARQVEGMKDYRVELSGEALSFAIYTKGINRHYAKHRAEKMYQGLFQATDCVEVLNV